MRSKNSKAFTTAERAHVELVKACPCSVCGKPAPSTAHHIKQGDHWTTVALCGDCHQGSFNGWHGEKRMWLVMKMTELDALSVTIRNVLKLIQRGTL
ncbi:TPA: hypothetical protein ACOFC6_003215 [Stenotrophomonas maltophilia]